MKVGKDARTTYLERGVNVGSLFSGVGGMDLGLARAGFRHAFFCESDEYRRRVLARHWPGVPVYTDVRLVAGLDHSRRKPRRELALLCGGFPCQDLSIAGRRAGLTGERSGLFFEFARVADALVGPGGWVLLENVPGLLSSRSGRDFAIVLATLAELGFHDLAWRVLDSRYFGVPQRRRRVFVVARRATGDRARQVLLEPESGGGDLEASDQARQGAADGAANRFERTGAVGTLAGTKQRGGWRFGADEGAAGHLVAAGLVRRYGKGADSDATDALIAHTLRSEGFDASEDGTGRGTPLVAEIASEPNGKGGSRISPQRSAPIHYWVEDFENGTLTSGGAGSRTDRKPLVLGQEADSHGVRTAPGASGRMDDPRGPEPAFVSENQRAEVRETTYARQLSGGGGKPGQGYPAVRAATQRGETAIDPKPDGPRYAACGDAVTASVAQWIGERLMTYGLDETV